MSGLPDPTTLGLREGTVADLEAVAALEAQAHAYPWTRGNFTDSLAAGYRLQLLEARPPALPGERRAERRPPDLLGYTVAMPGVEEMHLLNITVRPDLQGRRLADHLMGALVTASRAAGATQLWLEVRQGNARARRLYERSGFESVGRRKAYYPAPDGREDAVVMRLVLTPPEEGRHGLD